MHNRVQRALARRERLRRSRDKAWMVFAGFAVAALFGWFLLVEHLRSELGARWWGIAIYAAIGLGSTLFAFLAFGAARRITRRMDEDRPLDQATEERSISVWDEILRRR